MMQNGGTSRLVRLKPAHHREPPDAHVLMHHAVARDQRAIADLDPSGKQRAARDDRRVANAAIMGNMRILHEEIAVADDRHVAVLAAAMDRDALAKDIAIADSHPARAAGVGDILRLVADYHIGMDHVVLADSRYRQES